MYSVLAHKKKETELKVDSIDLMLTEKCSLKCKDCSNLMQFYAKPVDEDFEIVIKSIDKFLNTVDYVREIRLLGGEPLMYKRVDEVVKYLLKYKNFDHYFFFNRRLFRQYWLEHFIFYIFWFKWNVCFVPAENVK